MKLTTNICTAIVCIFFGLQLTQAQCDGNNDIIQSDGGRNYILNTANGFLSIGNSFTATCSGLIDGISFWTGEIPGTIGGVSITVELYRNPFSNSRVLLASKTNDISFSNSTTPRENYFSFENDSQLVSGTLYGFRIIINDNNQPMQVKLNSPSNPNPYAGGRQFTNNFEQTPSTQDQDLRFQIHYRDQVSPNANCRNITRILGANGTVTITPNNINNGSTDADSGLASFTVSQSIFDCANMGINTVTLSVFDQNGNSSSCQATVTIVDETPPVLTCPDNITVFTDSGTPAVVNYADIIYEECTAEAAPNGFSFLAAKNGKSYFLSQTKQPAPIAYSLCQALGGHLATIENEEDNTMIRAAANAIVNTDPILIGYNDLASEGNFVWHSGSSSTYTNWASAEPNNNLNNEDFTEMRSDGKWNDFYGLEMKYFVLELTRVNITQTSGLPSGATFPLGITTNTFEVTDNSGNTGTCSFTVEVAESAKVIHVNAAAATNGNGETWGTAYKYLQDALQDANSNASNFQSVEIWVADGVYYPDEDEAGNVTNNNRNETFALQDKIVLLGGFNGTETSKDQRNPAQNITILSGDIGQDDTNTDGNTIAEDVNDIINNNSFHVVTSTNADTTAMIDGFTVTAGNAGNQNGGGMLIVEGSPQVNQMHFIGNRAKFGGAMYVIDSSSNITNTKFTANTATSDSGAIEITEQNTNANLNITLTNILFTNNTSGNDGGALSAFGFSYTNVRISNATFYGNSASGNGGAVYSRFSDRIDIKNSIFYNNTGQDVYFIGNDIFNVSNSYLQETYAYPGGSNNLQNQPDPFEDAANGDFQLKNQSTAIDAGDNTANSLTLDLANNPRTYDDTFVTDTGIIGSGTAVIDMGAYERQENSAEIIYVNSAAASNGNGNSWGTAYKYLQDALQDASSNANTFPAIEIWVAEGVYYPDEDEAGNVTNNNRNATFALQSKVTLLGGFNGTETSKDQRNPAENITILSGDIGQDDTNTDGNNIAENTSDIMNNNSFHVVTGSNADNTAIIDGFTITAGDAATNNGGGMLIDTGAPQLNQLFFIGNTARYGGAMYMIDSSSNITNTTFTANTASSDSGAIEITEQNVNSNVITLTNVLFANNTSGNRGGAIGAFGNEDLDLSINNATFYGNSSPGFGGAVYVTVSNSIDIKNSIFYNNAGQDIFFGGNASFNVSYSYLQETYIYGASNNLQNQPNPFVDAANGDFQLKNQSTAIDAGDNTVNSLLLDLAGNLRNYNDAFVTDTGNIGSGSAVIDMGAFERQEDSCDTDVNNDGICDNEDPIAVCQNISLETGFGGITVAGDQLDGGSTDNIDVASFLINGETSIDLTYADLGDTQVTITVVDGDGNTSDCTATITLTSNVTFDVFISEYQPVVNSQNTEQQIELTGAAGEAFAGTLVVIEGDVQTGNQGIVMAAYDISGTFDANNLLVATIPNIPDPTHTVVLTSTFNGTVGVTNVDNGDGTVDTSDFGVIFDALGSSNAGVCCPIDIIYGTAFGGIDLAYIGSQPYTVFREGSTGDFYQISQTGIIYDSAGTVTNASIFNTTPTISGTFGSINPSLLITLQAKVYLQGASLNQNVGQENLMRDDLRVAGLLPTASPYGDVSTDAMTFADVEPNNAIVDWIWVELRDATNNTTVIAAQSALLQRDGDIVSVDGTTAVKFDVESGNYYIVIKHRNHIGIMSANTIALSAIETTINFANGSTPTYGTNAQTSFGTPSGIIAMWAGNANDDGIIQYSGTNPDTPSILSEVLNDAGNFLNFPTYTISGYNIKDINIDGNTQYSGTSPDTPIILQNALAHPGNFLNFSTYQIIEQLPENE
ncbi:MAG: HYR domain-containing protein [Bacteroidota bacterium]